MITIISPATTMNFDISTNLKCSRPFFKSETESLISILKNLNKDEIYKKHFIELKNRKQVRLFNDKLILNVNLNRDDKIRGTLFSYLHEKFNIKYNLNNTSNLISFISLRGLYNKDE